MTKEILDARTIARDAWHAHREIELIVNRGHDAFQADPHLRRSMQACLIAFGNEADRFEKATGTKLPGVTDVVEFRGMLAHLPMRRISPDTMWAAATEGELRSLLSLMLGSTGQ